MKSKYIAFISFIFGGLFFATNVHADLITPPEEVIGGLLLIAAIPTAVIAFVVYLTIRHIKKKKGEKQETETGNNGHESVE